MTRASKTTEKSSRSEPDEEPGTRAAASFPIIGIGASAGGIAALQKFFPDVPPDSGFAFVVIQHLDAEHDSALATIIQRCTSIETQTAAAGSEIEPDRIYVIPPGVSVTVRGRRLQIAKMAAARTKRTPIDDFFVSLAAEGESAAGVILSGTGSDGTIGLRAIKEHGGLTLAQEGAEYDGMMRSAVQSGLIDMVLPAEKMAEKLVNYFGHTSRTETLGERDRRQRNVADQLSRIGALLRNRTGHDFSGYKDNTILRRIQRRMQVLQIDDPAVFYQRLREEPAQVDLLFQDLLIGVTNFFRDPQAFEALERHIIPKLFEGRRPDETVRVWVPGCATGEEAYSIAMLLKENAPRGAAAPKLQIFATDIDERALEVARAGRYPAAIASDLTPKRLKEFFSREDGTYRIASDLREVCLFSVHNLLRDPPFSRLDLIACRNLLIYMGAELQEKVIPIFHYALRSGGYLFLGSSENVTRHARLFSTIDKPSRVFQKRGGPTQRLPEFPLAAAARHASPQSRTRATTTSLQESAERLLLDLYSPAYVVTNPAGELVYSSGGTGKYLELAAGVPDNNIFAMARRGLRMDLRAALHKAVSTGLVAVQNNIQIGTNGGRQTISLVVQPLPTDGSADPLYMVIFKDVGGIKPDSANELPQAADDVESANVNQLEKELRETRERLQITTEELESSNEELKSSNEELSSINEELQSSNEELETSKEELQSINEELQTVNAELSIRVDELSRANNDIANLLESTQIATVFLDRDLCIKSFTPTARDLFRLVESDVGRPLAHVRPRFAADNLQADIEQVLHRLGTIERRIENFDGDTRYMMRVLPYRTVENVIAGVVVTFVDVTRIVQAEERIATLSHALRDRVESLETLLELVPVGIFIAEDGDGEQIRANRRAVELVGRHLTDGRLSQMPATLPLVLDGKPVEPGEQPLLRAMRTGKAVPGFEARVERADGYQIDVMMSATPLFDEAGHVRGAIGALVDVSRHKKAERDQERLLHELQHRVKNILATVTALSSRMMRSSRSLPDFFDAFQQRLHAMARTHELLSAYNAGGAGLQELLSAILSSYAGKGRQNVYMNGAAVQLNAIAAAAFGMVFFELASNAAKYGALTADEGRIEISWKTESGYLSILWKEVGGPPIVQPPEQHFGTSFVQQSLAYELGGSVDLQFKRSGLECLIRMPQSKIVAPQF